jgi:hypothetical protein
MQKQKVTHTTVVSSVLFAQVVTSTKKENVLMVELVTFIDLVDFCNIFCSREVVSGCNFGFYIRVNYYQVKRQSLDLLHHSHFG